MLHHLSFITHTFTGGRTLQILNAKKEDAGRYTCVATNEAGETLKHYEVKVYGEIIWFISCLLHHASIHEACWIFLMYH